jgi:F-type H+-transporting ATP synthase subunit e
MLQLLPDLQRLSPIRNVYKLKKKIITPCNNLQVGRWSALGLGVLYGFTHNRSLHKLESKNKIEQEYERKERLIEQARAEYAKKHFKPTTSEGNVPDTSCLNDKLWLILIFSSYICSCY